MEIKKRLFPYPVLCGDTDDYKESTGFVIEPKMEDRLSNIILRYDYSVQCESLQTLLRKGDAEYVLHIECPATRFRRALRSGVPHFEYHLPKSQVNGDVQLCALIVACREIADYESVDLNEDYEGEQVSFSKGSILAYQNLPHIFVKKRLEDTADNDSLFTVVKRVSPDKEEIRPLEFDLYSDRIRIMVDEKTYEAFVRFQHSRDITAALLVLPALTYMLPEAGENPDRFEQYRWFQRLKKIYELNGQNFVQNILQSNENPVDIAQEMLQSPVSKAYRELFALEV